MPRPPYIDTTLARSNDANAYLHSVVYPMLGKAIGYEVHEVRNLCLSMQFGYTDSYLVNGDWWPVPARTTTKGYNGETDILTPQAFYAYVEFIQRFATQFGVVIPDPERKR